MIIVYLLLVSNVHILDCEISLHGDSSILLYGTDSIISGISVHDNGCGGIHMSGGDQVCYICEQIFIATYFTYICR